MGCPPAHPLTGRLPQPHGAGGCRHRGRVTKAPDHSYTRGLWRRYQMAASAGTPGGPTRVAPTPLWVAVGGCLAVIGGIFGLSTPAPAAADSGVIYTNAPQGYSSADLGSALLQSL